MTYSASNLIFSQKSNVKRTRSPEQGEGRRHVRRQVTRLPSAAGLVRAIIPYGERGPAPRGDDGDVKMPWAL